MAPPKEFESPTFRLGGGRSIQLSYEGRYDAIVPLNGITVNRKKSRGLPGFCSFFPESRIYWEERILEGGVRVLEKVDPMVDLDDLIFTEGDGLPSER